MKPPIASLPFYPRWILANGIGESLGLGTTFFLLLLAPHWETGPSALTILGAAAGAILLGAAVEGVLIGWAQAKLLHRRFAKIRVTDWIKATMIGTGLAWMIGSLPNAIGGLADLSRTTGCENAPPAGGGPPLWWTMIFAAGLGAMVGPVLGFAQGRVLHRAGHSEIHWMRANSIAWLCGMPVIFLLLHFAPWTGSLPVLALAFYLITFVAGCVVGAVHGRYLTAERPIAPTS